MKMLVSEFLSKNKNIAEKNVTFVTVAANPSIYKKKSVTKPKNEFRYYLPESLIDKGLKAHSNESNESNATKTQNHFLNFEAVDWLDWYNERAAIYEYENGNIRSEAEVKAFDDCIIKFRKNHKEADLETAVKTLMNYGLHNPFYKH